MDTLNANGGVIWPRGSVDDGGDLAVSAKQTVYHVTVPHRAELSSACVVDAADDAHRELTATRLGVLRGKK